MQKKIQELVNGKEIIPWQREIDHRSDSRRREDENKYFSLLKRFKEEKRINDDQINFLHRISLEELVALKIEIAVKNVGGYLYGLPIWNKAPDIFKNALLIAAISSTKSYSSARKFLGIDSVKFKTLRKKYKIDDYFKNLDNPLNIEEDSL